MTNLSFELIVWIANAAQEMYKKEPIAMAELSPAQRAESIRSFVYSSAPDDINELLSAAGEDPVATFIAEGENAKWDLYGKEAIIKSADLFVFSTLPSSDPASSPKSAVSAMNEHEDQFRSICLSTGHLMPSTITWLEDEAEKNSSVISREYGFIIMIHDSLFQDKLIPIELNNMVRQADLAGFKQILLDEYADANPALPFFAED